MGKLKTNWLKIWHNFIAQYAILAILVNLFIETFARLSTSPAAGLEFMIRHPLIFLFNSLIIFTCMDDFRIAVSEFFTDESVRHFHIPLLSYFRQILNIVR